jgi:hypothetical protein
VILAVCTPIHPVAETGSPWSPEEVAATVADYFVMLEKELRGEKYNKAEHNRQLRKTLRNRSEGSIEFKHQNISAVLIESGFPCISGYKPRGNYQRDLQKEILIRLKNSRGMVDMVESIIDASPEHHLPARSLDQWKNVNDIFVDAPKNGSARSVYERPISNPLPIKSLNYLEREARNAKLGEAGELFVMEVEHRRLWEADRRTLANRIEHVSQEQGDGLGYDIHSFEEDGRERLIEVKTTNFGDRTPFYASRREVDVSVSHAVSYQLYRVFEYRKSPKIFRLEGSLRDTVTLDAIQYQATLS